MSNKARWEVTAHYRTDGNLVGLRFSVEELGEVHDIIEQGPDWQALDSIVIRYVGLPNKLTIEETRGL